MSSDITKQFAVNWNNHMNHVKKAFDNLLNKSELTDVTLYAEGKKMGAHKMLLAACSAYFRNLFQEFPQEHPIVVLKGISYSVLADILKFIYNGEVSVDCDVFDSFLQTAEFLQISGLTDGDKHTKRIHKSDRECVEGNEEIDLNSDHKTIKSEKRLNSETKQNGQPKRMKEDNPDIDFNNIKCEPNVLTAIFPDEISDTLQEDSPLTSELFIQTVATTNNYTVDDSTLKIKDEESVEAVEEPIDESSAGSSVRISSCNFSENPLKCPICHKEFSHPYSLHHHKPVHLGFTKCYICHAVLSRKYNLKMHMKSRHNIT